MAEDPLKKLARLLGGVALTRGRLPHQVLGQLLVSNATSIEMAGAYVAIAATTGGASTLAQVAVRTAAPSLAVEGIARRREKRRTRLADRMQQHLDAQSKELDVRDAESEQVQQHHDTRSKALDIRKAELEHRSATLASKTAELEARSSMLDAQEEKLAGKQADLREDEADLHDRRRLLLEEAARGRADSEQEIEALRAALETLRASAPPQPSIPTPGSEPPGEAPPQPRRPSRASKKKTARGKKKSSRRSSRGRSSGDDEG